MKLLVLSHACVTPVNQEFFAEVERQTGWDLTIALPQEWNGEYGRRTAERWPDFQGDLVPLPVLLSGNIPLHVYRTTFLSLLRRVRPDAIYVHHEPYGLATIQLYAANALSLQCPIGFFTWQNLNKQYPLPIRLAERWVYRTSAFAFSGSESAASVLRSKGYDGPITLLPGSVDPDHYAPSSRRDAVRDELGAGPDVPLIGFMGRLIEDKGLATLADALNGIRHLPWRLALVGEGSYADAFARRIGTLGLQDRVAYPGYVPHTSAPDYLSAFDVLVIPSETQPNWQEQFGRVIIEAMACGTPVVGSDSGEIPHLLETTGGGLIFPERNASALSRRLETILQDESLRKSLAKRGREVVIQEYTNSTLARDFSNAIADASPQQVLSSTQVSFSE